MHSALEGEREIKPERKQMNKKSLLIATIVAGLATAAYARGGAAMGGAAGGARSVGAAGMNRAMNAGNFGKSGMTTLGHNEFGGFGMTGTHLASTQPQPTSQTAGRSSMTAG